MKARANLVLGRRDQAFRGKVMRRSGCWGDVGRIAPASVPFGTVVPSYGARDGKLMKPLERETGFEPATSSLGSWHSTTELLPLA